MGVGLAVACEGLSGLDRGLRVSSGFWFRVDKCVCVCVSVCVRVVSDVGGVASRPHLAALWWG